MSALFVVGDRAHESSFVFFLSLFVPLLLLLFTDLRDEMDNLESHDGCCNYFAYCYREISDNTTLVHLKAFLGIL